MVSSIEIAGYLLIVVGILYTFLKALGILGKGVEESEIESKMFTLKGGPGLILVGLGVILLIIGYVGENPTPSSSDTNLHDSSQIATEKNGEAQLSKSQSAVQPIVTAQAPTPTMAPVIRQTPASQPTVITITKDYLLGTWSTSSETVSFYYDNSFLLRDNTGTATVIGTFSLSGSSLVLEINMNPVYYTITYIDQNTLQINSDIYYRVEENQLSNSQSTVQPIVTAQAPTPMAPVIRQTPASQPTVITITKDYLLGTWSTSSDTVSFYYDNSFLLRDNTGTTTVIGTFSLSGSSLVLEINMNQVYYTITYIDQNTLQINSDIYYRVA